MVYIALLMMLLCFFCVVSISTSVPSISKDFYKRNSTYRIYDPKTTLLNIEENSFNSTEMDATKIRFKRQNSGGAGKFTEAAHMPQLKLLRLFLTMFKNLWADSHTGGSNPFHPYVPKPIVQLFKEKIVEFFFPAVGEDAVKH